MSATDLLLNTTGDVDLDTAPGGAWLTGLQVVAQRVKIILDQAAGEWFLDGDEGMDWLGTWLGAGKDTRLMERNFRAQMERIEGILRASSVSITRGGREGAVTLQATLETDEGLLSVSTTEASINTTRLMFIIGGPEGSLSAGLFT